MTKPRLVTAEVTEDGAEFYIRCPSCQTVGIIDVEQFKGEVSIDCPECEYHETHDLRED